MTGRILLTATAYFPDRDTGLSSGVAADEIRTPRQGTHVYAHLARAEIETEDWEERQRRLDQSLTVAILRAERLKLGSEQPAELVLRLGLDNGQMMSFLFPSDFLQRWSALGGVIAIDA